MFKHVIGVVLSWSEFQCNKIDRQCGVEVRDNKWQKQCVIRYRCETVDGRLLITFAMVNTVWCTKALLDVSRCEVLMNFQEESDLGKLSHMVFCHCEH